MCDKAILENGGMLKFVPDSYKNHKMCNKAVYNYFYALEFVSDSHKTQEMCNKAINIFLLLHNLFLDAMRLKK